MSILYTFGDFIIFILRTLILLISELGISIYRLVRPIYKDLSNDIILVTGAGSGIGRLMCIEFCRYCSTILALDYDKESLSETAKIVQDVTGCVIRTYLCDLRDKKSIDETASIILREFGRVTVLINNAGVVNGELIMDLNDRQVEDLFRVNFFSHFHLIKAFLPSMLGSSFGYKQFPNSDGDSSLLTIPRGHIVSISSIAGSLPSAGLADYCASKSAVLLFSESLELELLKLGIKDEICVTRILPFLINTNMFKGCKFTRSWLFPTVDAKYCARRIVKAVRTNEKVVYITTRYRLLPLIKLLLPTKVLHELYVYGNNLELVDQMKISREK